MKTKKTFVQRLKRIGPGAIVAAAVVGPGTVTTCGKAGMSFGYALVWALVFSVVAMVIMQRMTGKIGLVRGEGLSESINTAFQGQWYKWPLFILLICAIFVGNCAYEAGNIVGAATGITTVLGDASKVPSVIVITIAALALVMTGSMKYIAKFLTALVFVMAVVFFITAILVAPDMGELMKGLVPGIPDGATLTTIALIGTTLVPYCLYLHASSVAEIKKEDPDLDIEDALADNTVDSVVNAVLTALISISILVVGYSLTQRGIEFKSISTLATGLEPLAGTWAKVIFAIGIFAAGISSATTAPLAATYVITGVLGWSSDLKDKRFRILAVIVFLIGMIAAIAGGTPANIITFAQAFNGVALPISIFVLIVVASKSDMLEKYRNKTALNVCGVLVLAISLFMAYRTAVSIF